MIIPGLVSITFRKLSPEEIVSLVIRSGASAIEWGGDVHVPHGDIACAKKVRKLTLDAGLSVASYGSYYRVGHGEPMPFRKILATAKALGAPAIRVWAGKQGSDKSDEAYWKLVIEDSVRIARMAAAQNIIVSFECHGNTLTDTCAGTLRLLNAAGETNLRSHWQPVNGRSTAQNRAELEQLLPRLCHMHLFHWKDGKRLPLAEGRDDWRLYLASVRKTGRVHGALLEFVAGDDPDNYLADMAALKQWMNEFRP